MAIRLGIQNILLTLLAKLLIFCVVFGMIAVFSIGFHLTGLTVPENFFVETEKIFSNPQTVILIMLNVILGILIAYGMNHVNKNLQFFLDSPYEKILPSLGTSQPKIFFRTVLRTYITKTR